MPDVPPSRSDARAAVPRGVLDRPLARCAALGVVLLAAAGIAWIHRDSLFPPGVVATPAADPAARCRIERSTEVDKMVAEGLIGQAQAAVFKSRAEAFCAARFGPSRE